MVESKMEIYINLRDYENPEAALNKEWIDTDGLGNYASSTILGLNTRKNHGLYVISQKSKEQFYLLLSHLQEDFYDGKIQYQLYNSEYKEKTLFEGYQYQTAFKLDPFPTFIYNFQKTTLHKNIFLVHDKNRLIIRYKVEGQLDAGSRLVVRPFFAFRSTSQHTRPDWFVNQNVFEMQNQFRFLPFSDAPEIFMYYSDGRFIDASMWYHEFLYRKETNTERIGEDLLNPGFFEIPVQDKSEIFIAAGLSQISFKEVIKDVKAENERRWYSVNRLTDKSEKVQYMFSRVENFQLQYEPDKILMAPQIPSQKVNLAVHCFMLRRLLRSGVEEDMAQENYHRFINILNDEDLEELFKNNHSAVIADVISPFAVITVLYEFHTRYKQDEFIQDSMTIIEEILSLVLKNKIPFYSLKRNKLLFRQYPKMKSSQNIPHQRFLPNRQNFLLNVFWYNVLRMSAHLAQTQNRRLKKIERFSKKVQRKFLDQYLKNFDTDPAKALEAYPFAFHPSMIYALTMPFPILDQKQGRSLYTVLVKQFLSGKGIKFPLGQEPENEYINSPLLLGEFLEGWQLTMPDKKGFLELFEKYAGIINKQLHHQLLGYLPDGFYDGEEDVNRASGLATSGGFYFLVKLEEILKEMGT